MKEAVKRPRLYLIDEYRGLVVLNMVVYHAIWDMVYLYNNNWRWFIEGRQGWRVWIGGSFILISGFCWSMSRNPLGRGLQVFGGGILVSAVTLLLTPYAGIRYGVLTLLGSSMMLMLLADTVCRYIRPLLGAVLSVALFVFTWGAPAGYLGLWTEQWIRLPEGLYANWLTTYLGFPESGFVSADYYPVVPWFFLYLAGYFLYRMYIQRRSDRIRKCLSKSLCPPLGWIGRNALVIYMVHQPIIAGILAAIHGF